MKKNDVFTFTAPNGAEVTGVVVLECPCYEDMEGHWEQYIIYAQNRIAFWNFNTDFPDRNRLGGILIDYAILPDYDKMLEKIERSNRVLDTFSPDDYV